MSLRGNKVALKSAPITPGLRFVCVVFDFLPSVHDELKLEVGDVVKILQKIDDFWLHGLNLHNGNTGQFPCDFVKDIPIPKYTGEETLLYALDSFYPEAAEDLPFVKGDIIVLERKINNEWGSGRLGNGSHGIFPLNYTERLMPLAIASQENDSSNTISNSFTKTTSSNPDGAELGRARATMNLTAQLDEELSFRIGDEIIITEVLDDGSWYKGKLGSESGTFPASFVKLLKPLKMTKPSTKFPQNSLDNKNWKNAVEQTNFPNNINRGPNNKDQTKSLSHHFKPIEADRKINHQQKDVVRKKPEITAAKLNQQIVEDVVPKKSDLDAKMDRQFSGDAMPKYNSGATESSTVASEPLKSNKILYTVIAKHRFTGNTDKELSFKAGTLIPIHEEVDDHWLMGKIREMEGFVPRSYVAVHTESVDQTIKSKNDRDSTSVNETSDESDVGHVKTTSSKLETKHHVYTAPQTQSDHRLNNHEKESERLLLKKAVVIRDFQARTEFDLNVLVGEMVWIFRDVDENWCEVKNESGQKGIIPTSYIELITTQRTVNNSNNSTVENGADFKNSSLKAYSQPSRESYQYSYSTSVMPVLPEQATVTEPRIDYKKQLPFTSPKPFIAQKPTLLTKPVVLPFHNKTRNQNGRSLQKSTSVDSAAFPDLHTYKINRSNSNPQSKSGINKDMRVHLKAWQQARIGSPTTPPNERSIQSSSSETDYEIPLAKKPNFSRAVSRSASMREKRSPRTYEGVVEKNTAFVKIKSDSDLTIDAMGRRRSRDSTVKKINSQASSADTKREQQSATPSSTSTRSWNRDSVSTASTGSSSSMPDSRTSRSTHSDVSNSEAPKTSTKPSRFIARSAPPVPPHCLDRDMPTTEYPPIASSPWSPPVPERKQSLQRDVQMEVSSNPRPGTVMPSRPAPKLPPRELSLSPQKKVAPMRPANPPRASINRNKMASNQEKVRNVTSRETKDRMEKLRSDIEDYSRMKRDLESLYQGTLDGKERREISENMEFVKANLRRLQAEFHTIIEGQQDHIYESIEQHMRPRPPDIAHDGNNSMYDSLPAPPLPPVMDSPGSIRKKRKERKLMVATELIKTEKDFLIDVTVTVEDIMDELIDRQIPQQTISILFGNIVQIKAFSERFLKELEEALENESSLMESPEALTIGQVFIDNIPDMKDVYMPYCRNHDDAMALIEKLEKDDRDFMLAVACCLDVVKSKINNVIDLGSFLIKPVQRFLKYPLLINELIKLTDASDAKSQESSDHDKLILAAKMMQTVANDINEDKRTKDLVRKYKNAGNEGLSEKLQKISMKSLKKKSTRISHKIGQVTGISTHETKDAQFDKVERRFKVMERAAKLFVTNITTYCDKCQEVLCAEFAVAKAMIEVVGLTDQSHPVAQYQAMANQMSGPLYRQFHDQVQLQVLSPISSLIVSFKGPQTIITKRMDKLIDYERSQKNSDSKEKIQAAKHDYEALNKSLLDELPKLCDLGLKLISSCSAIFARVHRDFEGKLLNALRPLLKAILQLGDGDQKIPNNLETYDRFLPLYSNAVQNISKLNVVPASFGALSGPAKNSTESQRRSRTSQTQKPQGSPITTKRQSAEDKRALMQKYKQDLHVAVSNYSGTELMDISCCEGDLLAVLKKQDPMGNANRWFVNKGGSGASTGFVPASILRPYDPERDELPKESSITSPVAEPRTPVPVPRTKSPTPSSRSASSGDSNVTPGGTKTRLSPFQFRETLSRGTLPIKEDGTTLDVPDFDFEEEDEIFDEKEYDEISNPGTSPRNEKQHFRAEYDFNARSNLELSLKTGLIVKLIIPHDTDGNPEWWYVSNSDGKQGFVPSNYLTKAEYL